MHTLYCQNNAVCPSPRNMASECPLIMQINAKASSLITMTEPYYPKQNLAIHAFCEECGYHPLSHIKSYWIDPAIKDASLEA